ncbi:MAG: hypothetical protein ACOCY6_00540 [Halodesulfurarchaeum sp.]
MSLDFDRQFQEASFYSPLEDFERTTVEVELRTDPLTGRQTRIVPEAFVEPEESPELEEAVVEPEGCFFCPGTVKEATPEYPDFVGFDRGSVGEATSFPNLNPYGSHSNVVVLTEDHYVPMEDLSAWVLADGFQAAWEYVDRVLEHDSDARRASINMNFLPTAGSSIIHPHMQTLLDDQGTAEQQARIAGAKTYEGDPSAYFDEAIAASEEEGRFVGSTGDIDWYAPFAPGHHRHVRGVLAPEAFGTESTFEKLAIGVGNLLSSYAKAGLNSFNFGLHYLPDTSLPPHIDVVARSVFERYAWSDATFFETIHDERVIDLAPELYASQAAEQF